MINRQNITNGNNNTQIGGNQVNNYFNDLSILDEPIHFFEEDIVYIIEAFEEERVKKNYKVSEEEIMELINLEITEKEEKNKKNNLSKDYFDEIVDRYLPYFHKIDKFLKAPQNKEILIKYENNAVAMHSQISSIKKYYNSFEEIISKIIQDVMKSCSLEMKDNLKNFVIFINYMYWNCDIGSR